MFPYKKKVRFRLYFTCSVSGWVHYPCYSGVSVLPLQKKKVRFRLYFTCSVSGWVHYPCYSGVSVLPLQKKKVRFRLYFTCSVSGWVHYPCYSGVSVLPLQKKSQISFILYLQCFWLSSLSMLQWRKCSPPTKKKSDFVYTLLAVFLVEFTIHATVA